MGKLKNIPLRYFEICSKQIPRNTKQGENRIRPAQYVKARFCSKKCKGIHHSSIILGSNNPNYNGGISTENHIIRGSVEYKKWRMSVFYRDRFRCQVCGTRGNDINAHHLKPFAIFLEDRFDINNGVTLCVECHQLADNLNKKLYDF
jgi:hypothetical protein